MGADEVTCGDIYNPLDWDHDGVVNLTQFAVFAKSWRSHDPNDPHFDPNFLPPNPWNPMVNLHPDYVIDMKDLAIFCQGYPSYAGYPWMACWHPPIPIWPIMENSEETNDPNGTYDPNEPTDPNESGDPNFPGFNMCASHPGSSGMSMERAGSLETQDSTVAEAQQLQENIDFLYQAAAAEDPDTAAGMYEFIGTLEQELSDIYGTLPGYDFTQ